MSKKMIVIAGIICTFILGLNILILYWNNSLTGIVENNSFVENQDISGIAISDLDNTIENFSKEKLQQKIIFKHESLTAEFTYEDLQSTTNASEIIREIRNYYSGNLFQRVKKHFKEKDLKKEYNLTISFNSDAVRELIQEQFQSIEENGHVEYSMQDTTLELVITKSRKIDYTQVLTDLKQGEKDIYILTEDVAPNANIEEITEYLKSNSYKVEQKAKDASISFSGDEILVTDGYNGKTLNVDRTIKDIQRYVAKGETLIPLSFDETEPEIKAEELRVRLNNIKTKIGSFTTSFATSAEGRSANVAIAAKAFDGKVLAPGETISFINTVGAITRANGYQTATVFSGGKAVDGVGGGVCQVATTLYNAALYANLEIVERHNHGLPVGYVQPSLDATISTPSLDLKIKNTSGGYIYIRTSINNKQLTFDIYGEEKKYDVELTSTVLNYIEPSVNKVLDTNLSGGTEKTTVSGKRGYRSEAYRIVKQNGETIKKEKLSTDTYSATAQEIHYNN